MMSILTTTDWGNKAKQLLEYLKTMELNIPTIIMLRHSAREEPKDVEDIFLAPLTQEGMIGAKEFGTLLPKNKKYNLFSSPVDRCKQTALSIEQGINQNKGKTQNMGILDELANLNGDRGKLVKEITRHSYNFVNYWIAGFFDELTIESALSTAQKIARVVILNNKKHASDEIDIHVSHDFQTLICLFYWTGILATDEWVKYNEGFILQFYPDRFKVYFHDRIKEGEYPHWWKN